MSDTPSSKRRCRRESVVPTAEDPVPSPTPPLLDLLERHPILFAQEVLARLAPTDRASLAGAGLVWRDVAYPRSMFPTGLPRAEMPGAVRVFKISGFVRSIERLAWARENGCPWVARTFALAAAEGHLKVLKWAREQDCPEDEEACAAAAHGGHLEALQWLREHGCPWDEMTCLFSALGGHLEVLKWAREHDCPWTESTCAAAAWRGHLQVLQWAREHGCPWDEDTCKKGGLWWAPGGVEVGAGAALPLELDDLCRRRSVRAAGGAAMGAGARVPMG